VHYGSYTGPPRSGAHKLRAGQKGVTRVRVVVADDDLLLREGLASLLDRSGFDVVGQADDGTQLLAMVRDTTPDLVVADIRMPPMPASPIGFG
jgi:CheY-like chemotaxis protein